MDQPSNQEKITLQQNWKAKSIFHCNGKVMEGNPKDKTQFYLVLVAIILLVLYLSILLAPSMWRNLHPITVFIYISLILYCLYHKFACRYSDPGILLRGDLEDPAIAERKKKEEEEEQQKAMIEKEKKQQQEDFKAKEEEEIEQVKIQNNENEKQNKENHIVKIKSSDESTDININNNNNGEQLNSDQSREKEELVVHEKQKSQHIFDIELEQKSANNNSIMNNIHTDIENQNLNNGQQQNQNQKTLNIQTERYCRTCKIMKPPLASHCSHCDQCIKSFDHHCYVVGNCIGERNYKHFMQMLLGYTAIIIYMIVIGILLLIKKQEIYSDFYKDFWNDQDFLFFATIASGVLLFFSSMSCGKSLEMPAILSLIFFICLIVKSVIIVNKQNNISYDDNPAYSIIAIIMLIFATFFAMPVTFYNCFNACQAMTLKEKTEIERKGHDLRKYTVCNPLKNIKNFFKSFCYISKPSYILLD